MYGESSHLLWPQRTTGGLSPRVRGIRRARLAPPGLLGSIPACTGNPNQHSKPTSSPTVYPRVYGESRQTVGRVRPSEGLSPRVRGIHHPLVRKQRGGGSIPACTGNPCVHAWTQSSPAVYPRVYGESLLVFAQRGIEGGLSPRVRGILALGEGIPESWRSIPACTGNPAFAVGDDRRAQVYPRVYGESARSRSPQASCEGLSPRVRGIQAFPLGADGLRRSIPACTGNPRAPTDPPRRRWVYPRVYGESACTHRSAKA